MDNQPQIKIPDSVLKENQKHACKSTKKERRKKLMKFADIATRTYKNSGTIICAPYNCFECSHHKKSDQLNGQFICALCQNGHYFEQK
jgi:predicted Zn-ribbon and HTH transcriptional regulator